MALFDFFRRRRDEGRPQSTGGLRGFFSRLFNRRKPAVPEPGEVPEAAAMEEPELAIDDTLFDGLEDVYTSEHERPVVDDLSPVTTVADEFLLDRYSDMLDTMVERGYIKEFDNQQDAAEFLRVLSSEAWEEAHAYWYSVEALQQIQDAIARGATAGQLQEDYNRQVEKKSNAYLSTWENWLSHNE